MIAAQTDTTMAATLFCAEDSDDEESTSQFGRIAQMAGSHGLASAADAGDERRAPSAAVLLGDDAGGFGQRPGDVELAFRVSAANARTGAAVLADARAVARGGRTLAILSLIHI